MIIRFFFLSGLVVMGVAGYFIVIEQPPTVQAPPLVAEVTRFQELGLLPSGDIEEDEEVEHGIFDVPEMDAEMLELALENMGDMPGMDMGDGTMNMEGDGGSMAMAEGTEGAMNMEGDSGSMAMAEDCEGTDGLSFCTDNVTPDREIAITMREWGFDQPEIEVMAGETIRFTVRNDGTTLHEFMFMTMPMMQAVNYRANRADWSLLEHEALYEKSLLLPGQELTFVVEIQQAGSWMFMCMLPYHMQLGMMGQIATPGAAMQMDM